MEKWLRVLRGKFLPILILSMLFSLTTIAQRTKRDTTRQLMPVNAEGYTYSNGHYQNSFGIPTDTIKLRYRDKDSGYIAIKNGVFYKWDGVNWPAISGGGLSTVGIATANGFGGTSSGGTAPSLTLTTPLTGILKGNGTAMLAAIPGTDFTTIAQLGTKVDTSVKTKVARPLYVTIADSTLHSDTVSLSKAGVLKPGYVTNSNDTLATKADVRAGGGGGSGGTVTNVSAITLGTTGTDLTSTVATPNTTPVITLNVPNASAANRGALLAADWTTFNGKLSPTGSAAALTGFPTFNQNTTGNAATVTTNANLTGPVTSTGNATAIGTGAISNTMLANSAVALLSGTNSGDNATNTQYSGLVTNATHTGDATGSTVLTLVTVNSNVGTFGTASSVPTVTVNGKGLITAAVNTAIQVTESQVTNLVSDLAGKQAALTLTTTGTSGSATLTGATLNIPSYTGGSSGTTDYQTQTATAGQISFPFTSVPASYNDYWLDINSAVIPQSYYTNSSGTITFTSALTAGDKVQYHRTK
jgi:hypothetical protein